MFGLGISNTLWFLLMFQSKSIICVEAETNLFDAAVCFIDRWRIRVTIEMGKFLGSESQSKFSSGSIQLGFDLDPDLSVSNFSSLVVTSH